MSLICTLDGSERLSCIYRTIQGKVKMDIRGVRLLVAQIGRRICPDNLLEQHEDTKAGYNCNADWHIAI